MRGLDVYEGETVTVDGNRKLGSFDVFTSIRPSDPASKQAPLLTVAPPARSTAQQEAPPARSTLPLLVAPLRGHEAG